MQPDVDGGTDASVDTGTDTDMTPVSMQDPSTREQTAVTMPAWMPVRTAGFHAGTLARTACGARAHHGF